MEAKAFAFFLLILCFFIGCSREPENSGQEPKREPCGLTLPQIPRLPSSYKPTNKDIQIALRNAGFYEGAIDGDIGPLSRRAIREFQAENNLAVDGRVGLKTWAELSTYLPGPQKQGIDLPLSGS